MQFITRDILKKLESIKNVIKGREVAWRAIVVQPTGAESTFADKLALDFRIFFENSKYTYLFVLPSGGFLFFAKGVKNEELEAARMMAIEILEVESKNVVLHDMSVTSTAVYDFMNTCEAFFDIEEKSKVKKVVPTKVNASLDDIVLDDDPQILAQMASLRRSRSKLHVMLVDDEPMTMRMVESVLRPEYEVVKYENVIDALDAYASYAPNIIFLDINMPPFSGHDILKKLVAYDKEAFIVMLSGNAFPADIKSAISSGAKGFIAKPFSKAKILSYIEVYKRNHNK